MAPQSYPLTLYRGDTFSWRFVFWNDLDRTIPYDLTGVTPAAQIRATCLLMTLDCTVLLPNTVAVELPADAWPLSWPALTAAGWDLQLTQPDGTVHTMVAGPVYVTTDVTRLVGAP
jgi:hypothetical protein